MRTSCKLLSVLLTIALLLSVGTCALAASSSPEVSQRETENAEISQYIATQGMVLLENDGALPIAKGGPIALFGGGAVKTIKGGTGSGDVNQRDYTTVWEGFEKAGYDVVTTAYLEAYEEAYNAGQNGVSSGPFREAVQIDDIDVTPYLSAAPTQRFTLLPATPARVLTAPLTSWITSSAIRNMQTLRLWLLLSTRSS